MSCVGCWMSGTVCTPKAVLSAPCFSNVIHIKMSGRRVSGSREKSGKTAFSSGLHKIPRIWVMVADKHVARVFSKQSGGSSLVAEISPKIREQPELTNKNVGRVAGSSRSAARHKYEPHMNKSHKEEIAFAHEIAAWLDIEAGKGSFDRLVLVAAPHMLGELRKTIGPSVYARIVAEVNKDLTKMNEADLRAELGKILWF